MSEKKDMRKDPKEYMKLAVEVMKKSIPERKKKDPSPYVGAVLVFPDGTVETAYRGEFREGDHAEYTVLDKKHRQKDLTGCWLFATLEPCAPGARNAPKLSCAERIVNARISDVWFGIEDKNPKVDHGGIDHLVDNHVNVHQFLPEFHNEIEEINKEFMTWANMKNDEEKAKKQKPQDHLNERAKATNIESLSEVALLKFITESKRKFEPKSDEFLQELKEMDLLEYNENTKSYSPTGNAILLFGKSPRNKFSQAAVKAKVHYGDGKTGAETFNDALVLIPDQIEEWLKKVLPASIDRSKFKAQQVPSFPVEVIREAVINALAHRNYAIDGAKIQLEVFPDRILVKSPGEPVPPITIKTLNNFTATSYSRNKKIAFIFNEMEYMEESAVGMDTFRSMRENHKLPLPIFEYDGINTVVTFPRTTEAVRNIDNTNVLSLLNDQELAGLDFVKAHVVVSRKEYEDHFGFERKKASNQLKKMKELGLIGDNGENPKSNNYRYVYNPNS
ncbi:MAG: ATP-binding protein [Bacteroidales bacterium]|jgi:ATP-dependent DNA helicase RecG|nr:ATP-binding protein [Bacteroidales bacterium]